MVETQGHRVPEVAPRRDQSTEEGRQRCGASCQAGVTIRHTGGEQTTIRRQE